MRMREKEERKRKERKKKRFRKQFLSNCRTIDILIVVLHTRFIPFLLSIRPIPPKNAKERQARQKISTWNYTYQLVIANYNLHRKMNTWVKEKNQIGNRIGLQLQRIFFSLRPIVAEYRIDYLLLFTLHSFINYILERAYSVLCMCVMRNGRNKIQSKQEWRDWKERTGREREHQKRRSTTHNNYINAIRLPYKHILCSSISLHRW